jgi:hypothetical protein
MFRVADQAMMSDSETGTDRMIGPNRAGRKGGTRIYRRMEGNSRQNWAEEQNWGSSITKNADIGLKSGNIGLWMLLLAVFVDCGSQIVPPAPSISRAERCRTTSFTHAPGVPISARTGSAWHKRGSSRCSFSAIVCQRLRRFRPSALPTPMSTSTAHLFPRP